MNELSIEEKAKRYNELLVKAKQIYNKENDVLIIHTIEDLFPELAESEDERIRKELITHCRNIRCVTEEGAEGIAKWIAWLEKQGEIIKEWGDLKVRYIQDDLQEMVELKQKTEQGEQKPADEIGNYDHGKVLDSLMSAVIKTPEESLSIDSDTYNKIVDECIYGEQKPTDKVESSAFKDKLLELFHKFRRSCKGQIPTNEEILEYVNAHIQELISTMQKPAWSEDDEKILKAIHNSVDVKCLSKNGLDYVVMVDWLKSLKDRILPQPKQGKERYTVYNPEDLVLVKAKNYKSIDKIWSEEDKNMSRFIGNAITANDASTYLESKGIQVIDAHVWLEELEERVQPQPKQEWSMYDETILKALIDHFEYKKEFNEAEDYDIVLWLKSLRPQNRWKPSDELLDVFIKNATDFFESNFNPLTDGGVIGAFDDKEKMIEEFKEYMKEEGFNEEWI